MTKRARQKSMRDQQRLRRTDGSIVRVEVSLNAKRPGDIYVADYLADLPPDVTKSDYLRDALLDKITAERRETDIDKEIAALRDEIVELKALIVELAQRKVTVQMVQAAQVTVGPAKPDTLPEAPPLPGELSSSGLDMSRSRPRPALQRGAVQPALVATEEFDEAKARRQLVNSVFNAQPGRRQ